MANSNSDDNGGPMDRSRSPSRLVPKGGFADFQTAESPAVKSIGALATSKRHTVSPGTKASVQSPLQKRRCDIGIRETTAASGSGPCAQQGVGLAEASEITGKYVAGRLDVVGPSAGVTAGYHAVSDNVAPVRKTNMNAWAPQHFAEAQGFSQNPMALRITISLILELWLTFPA